MVPSCPAMKNSCRYFFLLDLDPKPSRELWHGVPFACLVEGFESVLNKSTKIGNCHARWMLDRYATMMNLKTGMANKLVGNLWRQHKPGLERLLKWRENPAKQDKKGLVYKLWQKHDAILATLLRKRWDVRREITRMLDAKKIIAQAGKAIPNLTLSKDKCYPILIRLAVNQWDAIDGMTSAEEWTRTKMILFSLAYADFYTLKAGVYICPKPKKICDKFLAAIEAAGVASPPYEIDYGTFTISHKMIRTGGQIKRLEEVPNLTPEVDKIRDDVVEYLADILPKIDKALAGLPRTKQ